MLKWLLILVILALGYGCLVALVYFGQRALQYFPEHLRTPPAAAGLPQAQEVFLDTADGEKVIAWHIPPQGEAPILLYFHGNGGSLARRAQPFRLPTAHGIRLLSLCHRPFSRTH